VKKLFCMLIVAMVTPLLSGCFDNGSSAPPPAWLPTIISPPYSPDNGAVAGDGRVKLTWTASPGVEYWIFSSTDSSLTAFNLSGLANPYIHPSAVSPFYMCGLLTSTTGTNWTPYYFAANGRINGGPGGPSSPTTPATTPYNASANWAAIPTPTNGVPSSTNLYGVGYASLTTCSNNATSAAGNFAAVGAGGAIFTSNDGKNWNAATNVPSGLPDLFAVTGNATNLNNPTTPPALLWVAVGDGGVSVYSNDGNYWYSGRPALGNPALRSLTHAGGTFFAVGDGGTIISSIDGINWTTQTSYSPNNLRGVTHGSKYVAVGDSGTILVSANGTSWGQVYASGIATLNNLRQVAAVGSLYVAVGDAGTIVTSKDNGATWIAQTLPGAPNLVGVTAETQLVANDVVDGWLGVVPNVQFVAVDSSGNTYTTKSSLTSVNGLTWSSAIPIAGISSLNALVSSGFGYVAAGNSGATAYAF
jgi:hypothetical protein